MLRDVEPTQRERGRSRRLPAGPRGSERQRRAQESRPPGFGGGGGVFSFKHSALELKKSEIGKPQGSEGKTLNKSLVSPDNREGRRQLVRQKTLR